MTLPTNLDHHACATTMFWLNYMLQALSQAMDNCQAAAENGDWPQAADNVIHVPFKE